MPVNCSWSMENHKAMIREPINTATKTKTTAGMPIAIINNKEREMMKPNCRHPRLMDDHNPVLSPTMCAGKTVAKLTLKMLSKTPFAALLAGSDKPNKTWKTLGPPRVAGIKTINRKKDQSMNPWTFEKRCSGSALGIKILA